MSGEDVSISPQPCACCRIADPCGWETAAASVVDGKPNTDAARCFLRTTLASVDSIDASNDSPTSATHAKPSWSQRQVAASDTPCLTVGAHFRLLQLCCAAGDDTVLPSVLGCSARRRSRPVLNSKLRYPLAWACYGGHLDCVKLLLADSCTDPNVGKASSTPLFLASAFGHVAVVRQLLACRGVDVNRSRQDGVSPLLISVQQQRVAVVRELLTHPGIKVNARSLFPQRVTPLLMAIRNNDVEAAQLLLAHPRLDLEHNMYMRETTLEVAEAAGATKIAALLRPFYAGSQRGPPACDDAEPSLGSGCGSASRVDASLLALAGQPACPPSTVQVAWQDCLQRACASADALGGFQLPHTSLVLLSRLQFAGELWKPVLRSGGRPSIPPGLVVPALGRVFCDALHLLWACVTPATAPAIALAEWKAWWAQASAFALQASFHASSDHVVTLCMAARLDADAVCHAITGGGGAASAARAAGGSNAASLPAVWHALTADELAHAEGGG